MSEPATEWPAAQPLSPLEERVHRLEMAVAALQENNSPPERAAESSLPHKNANGNTPPPQPNLTPAIVAAVAESVARAAIPVASSNSKLTGVHWLLIDICREAVAIFWMFIDLNYKVAWSTRLLTFILLPAILLSQWWVPFAHVPVIGEIIDKLIDLILAFVMFKALSREARRYMETRGPS
ncbi:MAG TPA: hypothetical protein VE988_21385 [Gemmataceae bacterium]|nr:hypothetical protein [Gemmataceae bacterium]